MNTMDLYKNSKDFYQNLPIVNDFFQAYKNEYYFSPPEDWYLFMTDIKNSTSAIEQGKYKEVNISAALCVIAIANLLKNLEYPFVFGGDGVTLLIQSSYLEKVKKVLFSLKNRIYEVFGLELRVGCTSIKELKEKNLTLKIAKLKISDCYCQALFMGNALPYFEDLLKRGQLSFTLPTVDKEEIDLTGFSCS